MREQHCGTRTVVEQVFRSKGITITPYWESSASQVIIDAVCVGIGISVLPYSLVSSYVKNGDLAILDVCDVKFERPFSIIYYTHKYQTKAFKSFYQFFLEQASNCDPDGRMP